MTVTFVSGDIFSSGCQALVNPVNCVGVMGAGLALSFKNRFPYNFTQYKKACASGLITIGSCLTIREGETWIINFPTKTHFKNKSELNYISNGLPSLINELNKHKIISVAIPALGCGLGGLNVKEVKPVIEAAFKNLHFDVKFFVN